jgi:hypothetical protein
MPITHSTATSLVAVALGGEAQGRSSWHLRYWLNPLLPAYPRDGLSLHAEQ